MKPGGIADKAKAAWGDDLPHWVAALAQACDRYGLRRTADRLRVSPATVSLAVNRRREKWDFIRPRVESELLATEVQCPALGLISQTRCLTEQARPFSPANPAKVHLYRACRSGCPHFKGEKP